MVSRVPALSPFANTDSPLSIVIGKGPTPRIISIRPWLAVVVGLITAILMGWYLVATLYIVFKDEMLARLLNQQTEMQYAYEDRLAALRNQIDKVTSRQLLDQNSLEGKLHELISRQAQLETRQAIVAGLAEQPSLSGMGAGIAAPTQRLPNRTRPGANPAPPSAPLFPDAVKSGNPSLTTGSVSSFAPIGSKPVPDDAFENRMPPLKDPRSTGGPEKRINNSSLVSPLPPAAIAMHAARDIADQMERQQVATLDAMDRSVRDKARRWSAIFSETGLDAERFVPASKKNDAKSDRSLSGKTFAAQGGPLVPLTSGKSTGQFEAKLMQLQNTIRQAEQMRRIVTQLPINRPIDPEFEISSHYGSRTDPFTRMMAMHTGMDFRAPTGTPVRSTAPGLVIEAGVNGGYGKMVEVDHGGGLTTRYAHLSSLDVEVGAKVSKGSILGRVGSTGRSTGAHLHYETRIDGDASDPARFIRAGEKFGKL